MSTEKMLIVKLTDQTPIAEGKELIRSILGDPVDVHIEQLFPEEREPDLATLFTVTLGSAPSTRGAIAALRKDSHIQYAHTSQERTLQS